MGGVAHRQDHSRTPTLPDPILSKAHSVNAMDTSAETPPAAPTRRRAWAFLGVAAAVLLLLALTPPYLNVNRLQRRIAASMSASLGRPVHLDRVTLHLLPLPGFTLENLVVSEDPAFGDEPVIRANTVDITLRLSSLWRRQVELSSIRFVEPSLNLVRNPAGRWNLQTLLNHAAAASSTPTNLGAPSSTTVSSSSKVGSQSSPAFPYIEATDARVNIKLGNEKEPFSLTEADFALWLPDASGWRVRLEGKPARTDQNINDPGILKLQGSLQRADTMAQVPVALTASWEGAPLGEASRLLSGNDAGWRGKLTVNATLNGPLGQAKLTLLTHIEELRRADFVPAHDLELLIDCSATADITSAIASAPACKLTSPAAKTLRIDAVADTADLSRLTQPDALLGLRVGSPTLPESFVLDAARLFSQRIPATATGSGNLSGSMIFTAGEGGASPFWQGSVHGEVGLLPGLPAPKDTKPGPAQHPDLIVDGTPSGFLLEPLNLMPPGSASPLLLTATVTPASYTFHLTGTATTAEMQSLMSAMPPLAEGLDAVLPLPAPAIAPPSPPKPLKLDITCTRAWRSHQICTQSAAPEPTRKKRRR